MIAKRAQQRILFKTRPERLSLKGTDTPSQTRVPSTTTTTTTTTIATTTAARTYVPRDEQRAIQSIKSSIKIKNPDPK
jgi:hypothetical protein